MNISNMRLYIAVYEARNIARVSEKMFLSHQAISKRIKSIESELGTELFTRSQGGLEPTVAGTSVYRALSAMMTTYNEMVASLPNAGEKPRIIRVAIEFYDAPCINAEKLFEYEGLSDGRVSVDVKYCTGNDCHWRLINGQADIAIGTSPEKKLHEFSVHRLSCCDPVIMMGASNPLASKEPLLLSDLEGQTLLSIAESDWANAKWTEALAERGAHPRMETVSFSTETLVSALIGGRGYHIAPKVFADRLGDNPNITMREFPVSMPQFEFGLFLYNKRPLNLYVDDFVAWFLDNKDSVIFSPYR